LALLGTLTILILLAAILTRRMTPLSALIAIPVAAALIGGFGVKTAAFMLHGIQSVAGVAGMFIFAILFFGIMTDAGMLDPIIDGILRAVGSNPARIVMGTSLLALLVHLDGSGAVTFLVTVPVMLPLYERLGMDRRVLACAASMAAGVNFLPWTGPMIRASASLHLPVAAIFNPLIPVQLAGIGFVFATAWWLGRKEARRLGLDGAGIRGDVVERKIDAAAERDRLGKELTKLTQELTRATGQLNNEAFLAKAPAHVVEGLKKRKSEVEMLVQKTNDALTELH